MDCRMYEEHEIGEFVVLFGAINRPEAWPSFLAQVDEINLQARVIMESRWKVVSRDQNRGATFIAQSVIKQNLWQSYMASGHPGWLFELFVNESRGL